MGSNRGRSSFFLVAAVAALMFLAPSPARALPVFARKYHTSCSTCHEMGSRLNALGEAFRLNGYRWPGGAEESMREEKPVPMGSAADKKNFPNSVWPADLPGGVPLSFRNISMFTQPIGRTAGQRSIEWEWELESAGAIGDSLSYFGHVNFVTDAGMATSNATKFAGIGHLNVEGIAGLGHLLNAQVGIVGEEEANYYHYRSHSTNSLLPTSVRTFARLDTLPYAQSFASPNLFKLRRGPGAALWGFTERSTYTAGYRMGEQDVGGDNVNVLFFQWAYKIGGMNNYGATTQSYDQGYKEKSLAFGVFGDLGTANVKATTTGPWSQDSFYRVGGDARLKVGAWTARAGGVVGSNKNPYGTLAAGSADYSTWFVQTDYFVFPWLLPEIRYEEDAFTLPHGVNLGQPNRHRIVPSVSALLSDNARVTVYGDVYTLKRTDAANNPLDGHSVGLLFDFAI